MLVRVTENEAAVKLVEKQFRISTLLAVNSWTVQEDLTNEAAARLAD